MKIKHTNTRITLFGTLGLLPIPIALALPRLCKQIVKII